MGAVITWPVAEDLVIVTDLDGTLVRTDLLVEGLIQLVKRSPHYLILCAWWLLKGRAHLKAEVARRAPLDASDLPYNTDLVELLNKAAAEGFELVLATASHVDYAEAVAAHLKIFGGVLASTAQVNLKGSAKLASIQAAYPGRPFCYAGDSSVDLPIWQAAAAALVVNASPEVEKRARAHSKVALVLPPLPRPFGLLPRAMRLHQWAKNALVFVPVITGHTLRGGSDLQHTATAFLAFGACASAVYLLNDLADMADDRAHPEKRKRVIAAGLLSPQRALMAALVLLATGFGVAMTLPPSFSYVLASYFSLTLLYSFHVKRVVLLDVFMLAALYTIRIIGGGAAAGIPISNWLMAFSAFFFLSLAFAKRFGEIRLLAARSGGKVRGRGYLAEDLPLLGNMGVSSGFIAALVFALYIHSEHSIALYSRGDWLWLLCPLILYWLSRVWLLAHRGLLHSDPVVFALKDRASYLMGAAAIVILLLSV